MTTPSSPPSGERAPQPRPQGEPRLTAAPGCARLLTDRILVHARARLVAETLNKGTDLGALIDPGRSGLILCGSNTCKMLARCRQEGFAGPLAADPAAYEKAAASPDQPFTLGVDGQLFDPTLRQVLDGQLQSGADFALTPTRFIRAGDRDSLKAACRIAADLGRNDTVFCVPLHIAWFNDAYIRQLIAVLRPVPLPKGIFLGSQLDPLDFVESAVTNLHRLVGEVANVTVLRTDFAAFDVAAHGALAASIGTGGSLRHIVSPDEAPESQLPPSDRSPTVLFPELIHFFRSSTLAKRFANVKAPACRCGPCDGRRIDTFVGDRDRHAAYCHGIRSWMDWLPDLTSHGDAAGRISWWRGMCKAAVDNHHIYNQQLGQRNAFKPPRALTIWAGTAGPAAA